ncbi:MAG: hypothetical protein AABX01_06850 [Candidatus Micrarchaeota archaeon]
MPADSYEDMAIVNSELRFLTVELMKMALEQHRSFDDVLAEYFSNAYKLKRKILSMHYPKAYKFKYHASTPQRKP